MSARLSLEPQRANAGDTIEVFVSLHTAPLWEIGALDAEPPSAATQLTLQLPDGVQAQGDWLAPSPGPSSMPGGHAAYSGEVVFTRQLLVDNAAVGGDHEIRCSIGYQACDGIKCLQPAVIGALRDTSHCSISDTL